MSLSNLLPRKRTETRGMMNLADQRFFQTFTRMLLMFTLSVLWLGLGTANAQVELEPRVFDIANQLRCPVCVSESVAQSSSPTSVEMRNLIKRKLDEGQSEAEVLAFFRERYGDWILLSPPRSGYYWVVWLAPIAVGLAILTALALYMRRWTRQANEAVSADAEYLDAVRRLQTANAQPGREER